MHNSEVSLLGYGYICEWLCDQSQIKYVALFWGLLIFKQHKIEIRICYRINISSETP